MLKIKNKNFIKITSLSILLMNLVGCQSALIPQNGGIDYEHAVPLLPAGAPTEDVPQQKEPILDEALSSKNKESLVSIGIAKPKSVYVPSTYTKYTNDMLYLNRFAYMSPHGYSSVQGFVKGKIYDLVAVVEKRTEQPTDPTYVMAYYFVSKSGKTIKEIGILPLTGMSTFKTRNAVTTNNAIYSIGQNGPGISFNGYDISGKRVSGPQNVMDATPLKKGGWLLLREYNPNFEMIKSNGWRDIGNHAGKDIVAAQSTAYYQDKNGQNKLLGTTPLYKFVHTKKIMVDQSTLTDSAETDMAWGVGEYTTANNPGNVLRSTSFGLLISGKDARIVPGRGMYIPISPEYQIHNNNALATNSDLPINIWQDREYGNWVFAEPSHITSNDKFYRIMSWQDGTALDGNRGIIWGGETRIAQFIQTPKNLIAYHNRGDSKYYRGFDNQGLAIDLTTGKYIPKEEMLAWLSEYGVIIGRSFSPAA